MKALLLAALAALSISAHADTLFVHTQYADTLYSGHISDYDDEDTIKQVEINDATILVADAGDIFANGFEKYNANWVWVGDDANGHEFSGNGQCSVSKTSDSNGTHVVLTCHELRNEPNRMP